MIGEDTGSPLSLGDALAEDDSEAEGLSEGDAEVAADDALESVAVGSSSPLSVPHATTAPTRNASAAPSHAARHRPPEEVRSGVGESSVMRQVCLLFVTTTRTAPNLSGFHRVRGGGE
jgi:hypothetical protein